MLFDDLYGNEHIKAYLIKSLERNNLPNTLIFSGIEGIGKSLFAKALAAGLMYPEGCSDINLKKIQTENHPDLHFYKPEGKTSIHNIASMRELILQVQMAPFEAKSKVFIIDEAHRMALTSSNALLKTLEEPNLDSYIILITSSEEELLPTIVSRAFRLKFSPLSENELISLLIRWGKTKLEAQKIAALSLGSISRASEIASLVEDDDISKSLIDILSSKKSLSYLEISKKVDNFQLFFDDEKQETNSKLVQSIDIFFLHIFMWYRDLHLLKNEASKENLFFKDKLPILEKQNFKALIPLNKVSSWIDETKQALNRNIKFKTCLENLFIKLDII
jgi:DNA polymerase III subunit delta'